MPFVCVFLTSLLKDLQKTYGYELFLALLYFVAIKETFCFIYFDSYILFKALLTRAVESHHKLHFLFFVSTYILLLAYILLCISLFFWANFAIVWLLCLLLF